MALCKLMEGTYLSCLVFLGSVRETPVSVQCIGAVRESIDAVREATTRGGGGEGKKVEH
jgi:hypothetical protein